MQARRVRRTRSRVLLVGQHRVVACTRYLPAHAVPNLLQVENAGTKNLLCIAPNRQLRASCRRRAARRHAAYDMAAHTQTMLAQGLDAGITLALRHLNDNAQLFAKQRLQSCLLATRRNLRGPVFGVARV